MKTNLIRPVPLCVATLSIAAGNAPPSCQVNQDNNPCGITQSASCSPTGIGGSVYGCVEIRPPNPNPPYQTCVSSSSKKSCSTSSYKVYSTWIEYQAEPGPYCEYCHMNVIVGSGPLSQPCQKTAVVDSPNCVSYK